MTDNLEEVSSQEPHDDDLYDPISDNPWEDPELIRIANGNSEYLDFLAREAAARGNQINVFRSPDSTNDDKQKARDRFRIEREALITYKTEHGLM